ncbi:hypothetical protein ACPXBB_26420, partial [Escherichia coli]|uniref:hypothetical protein n=1 Tax=Escherichia coli TaxID=562 RepID=UPI003CE72561
MLMTPAPRFEILAPRLLAGEFNEATAFGSRPGCGCIQRVTAMCRCIPYPRCCCRRSRKAASC